MTNLLTTLAFGAGLAVAATSASAVTISGTQPTLSIGDNFLVELSTDSKGPHTYTGTTLSFTATEDLRVNTSWTENPDAGIVVEASVSGGTPVVYDIVPSPAAFTQVLLSGQTYDFAFSGDVMGFTNIDIIFDVTAVPVAPAAAFLLSGLGAFGVARRKKKA